MELNDLKLPTRIVNLLKRNEINTIEVLLNIRNNRQFRLTPYVEKELVENLSNYNLKLVDKELNIMDRLSLTTREKNLISRIYSKLGKDIFQITFDDLINYPGCGIKTANKIFNEIKKCRET